MARLGTGIGFSAPDDVYAAVLSLADGLGEDAARSALAAFALLLANHIADDAVVLEAVAEVKRAFADFPEATRVGIDDPDGKTYRVGGAIEALRRIIAVEPAPTVPGAMTS